MKCGLRLKEQSGFEGFFFFFLSDLTASFPLLQGQPLGEGGNPELGQLFFLDQVLVLLKL